ncbi:BREX-2 system adenine-specific DNA-methyltransferase PglX [Actinacidiphila oryziradicis]|uniref:site-specific DNA-methyltransferase (adenine-specific) n=1 Tax=Actinacidiphila oryziradicis TaxID=2571141 RepID=A0A4V5MYT5_9ACTN|nr:BREX-2 system adenine-specific DNA-methyltransferase PglX [Actinacidiphila oryziradicis]TKA04749.1 BREX-2 system adenine-specific DNA-methyltransferase PglX [Actinacidiphila oryziradicis]
MGRGGRVSGRGVNQTELLKDLRKQVTALEDDLRARSEVVAEYQAKLETEYAQAREAKRTAATYGAWRDERITQVAAAWVLACVFVRFCEDNQLIADPFLAGPGERLKDAEDRDAEFFRLNPEKNDRDWLVHAFESLAATNPAVAGLFDRAHNPLWELAPSYEAASGLLKFWRRRGSDGEILHDFTDETVVGADGVVEHEGWSTRFLGDLYQDLSEHARKTYALLQTPEFVEEFILDLTLEPAVREFGLEPETVVGGDGEIRKGLRTIDPACGSGHFLLGLFKRLLAKWQKAEPGTDVWELIRRTSESVHGCDKNPFAVSIARFRLLIAALQAGGAKRLDQAPAFPINVAAGDSLLHGRGAAGIQVDLLSDGEAFAYRTEDVKEYAERCDLLGVSSYHVVVGNPPYITVKDKQENDNYRKAYSACAGTYALSVPFAQRLFQLAIRAGGSERAAGYAGQITANSFIKREFGKKLIEEFFVSDREGVHLTHVIDTSGAYIPGHGTPTVILIGRNHIPRQREPIRAVLGVRGEPSQPVDAARGVVWTAIVDQVGAPESESEWVSVIDSERGNWTVHPWSLSGGGASDLVSALEAIACSRLQDSVRLIGRTAHTGSDDSYFAPPGAWRRQGVAASRSIQLVQGQIIRDWDLDPVTEALFPYSKELIADLSDISSSKQLWTHRVLLRTRREPGGTHEEIGLTWYEWSRWHPERFSVPFGIAFPFVATHNHFALDRGGKVFKQTAPVIKLPERAGEDEHLELLGVLNSSAACFWLKQVCHDKGNGGIGGGIASEDWEKFYEFTGTKLQEFPLPGRLPLALGRAIDASAQELAVHEPSAVCASGATPTRSVFDAAYAAHTATRERMVALQEELDWEVYGAYDLVRLSGTNDQRLTAPDIDALPPVKLGERAFEIVLARKVAAGELDTAWFTRHHSTPITEIPAHWPGWYRAIVQNRIDVIEKRRDLALIERPECKRRWASEPWEKREKEALRTWLLDRVEDRRLWFALRDGFEQPRPLTISQLADELAKLDPEVSAVAALYAADHLGKRDLPLEAVLAEVLDVEHVPYLAALRYKDTGLRKRAQWEDVWEQQRAEDATGERLSIPVPPKYASADFVKTSYWSNRGKLDVPKERFVSYPGANPDADPTLLLGWAGWDHRDQAQALVNVVKDRASQLSWEESRIAPLLAGLAELMPWVRQWFGSDDQEWGGNAAEEFGAFLDAERAKRGLSAAQLAAWRPAPKARGRKAAATATARTAKKTDTAADMQSA